MLFLLQRALASLRASWGVTLLSVLAVALGTSIPTAIYTLRALHAQDPIPEKSERLFNVRVDSWSATSQFFDIEPGDPPKHTTYRDMQGLLDAPQAKYRTGVSVAAAFVFPEREELQPYTTRFQLCHADFFSMFNAPFAFGGGWSRADDVARRRVVVLSQEANDRLFGGQNSVGKHVRLGSGTFEIIGVLAPWNPTPHYFDIINNSMGRIRQFFVPFDLVREVDLGWGLAADSDAWGDGYTPTDPQSLFTTSEVTFIQYWVEVEPAKLREYIDFVDAYTDNQRKLGRFPRPQNNNRVTPLMEWMKVRKVVPSGSEALLVISLMFMAMCSLNLSSLLLGKYLGESHRMGVQRALGASRGHIFWQRIIECELVGLLGGVLGAVLGTAVLKILGSGLDDRDFRAELLDLDSGVFLAATAFALISGLVAGLYPAWQTARLPPAAQLKAKS